MSEPTKAKKMYVRSTPAARHALKKLVVDLQAPHLLPEITQEEFVTASWLWMAGIGAEEVARGVAAHVEAIRAALRGDDPRPPEAHEKGAAEAAPETPLLPDPPPAVPGEVTYRDVAGKAVEPPALRRSSKRSRRSNGS